MATISFAQKTSSSPYSFFGIGDQAQLKSVEEIGMGLMGGALDSEYQLSFTNPASYASLSWTTYVFAGGNKVTTIDDNFDKQTSSAASLTYLAMGIPIKGNQGIAFGLQLNTAVGYSLLDQKFEDETLVEDNLLSGNGGTNRVFFGYGYKFPFHLNVGVEAAYVFGGLEKSILNRRLNVLLATKHKNDSYVKGYSLKLGAQYSKEISKNLKLKLGLSAVLGNELTERGTEQLFSLVNIGNDTELPVDTLTSVNFKSKIKSPLKTTLSAGIGRDNKWFVGADYTFQNAKEFNSDIFQEIITYDNSSLVSFGGFYTPKFNSITSYWNRVTYRAGVNYKKLGLVINDTSINEYGMSFGMSLPMGLKISNINLGFELGQRGTTDNNLIKENFYTFRLSLSLNDRWFRKQKIY